MNGLSLATNGYWDADGLCLATDGYWCIEVIIDDGKRSKSVYIDSTGISNVDQLRKDELEILMLIKSFLICHS